MKSESEKIIRAYTCFPGLASLLQSELHERGMVPANRLFSNLVICPESNVGRLRTSDESILNTSVKIARRAIALIDFGLMTSLSQITEKFSHAPIQSVIDPTRSFGVFCERRGRHNFGSEDFTREIGSKIRMHFSQRGMQVPTVCLDDPQQRVVAEIRGSEYFIGLDLAGKMDSPRASLIPHHAPLNPTIASALIRFSSFRKTGFLLDPMAGSGTILREAISFDHCQILQRVVLGADISQSGTELLGQELNQNSQLLNVKIFHGDAMQLDYLDERACPLIVTNPPYGIRVGSPESVDRLYANFAKSARDKGVQEIVGITTRKRSWMESLAIAGYELIDTIAVDYGKLPVWMMKHQLKSQT